MPRSSAAKTSDLPKPRDRKYSALHRPNPLREVRAAMTSSLGRSRRPYKSKLLEATFSERAMRYSALRVEKDRARKSLTLHLATASAVGKAL